MDRITIIGMSPIGVSVGLALTQAALHDTEIVGTSGDRATLSQAAKMGAFNKTTGSLRSALQGAQMVILDTPLGETRKIMEAIGPILDNECVVTDIGTNKVEVLEWAKSYFAADVSFVAGRPLPKEHLSVVQDASASIFDSIEYCVIPAEDAAPQAVKTVVGMIEILGAKPLFMDAHEHDSYSSAVAHLPRILSYALVSSVSASSSWREIARLAGAEFKEVSQFAADDPQDNAAACLANPDAMVYWLDQVIAELSSYRDLVKQGDDSLADAFARAYEERARWKDDDIARKTWPEIPTVGQTIAGMVIGRRLTRRIRQITDHGQPRDGDKRK